MVSGCAPISLLGFEFSPVNEPPLILSTVPPTEDDKPGLVIVQSSTTTVLVTIQDDDFVTGDVLVSWLVEKNGSYSYPPDQQLVPTSTGGTQETPTIFLSILTLSYQDPSEYNTILGYDGGNLIFQATDASGESAERSWSIEVIEDPTQ